MNEPVIETPAIRPAPSINPVARMMGVITSPAATFEEVARRPAWIAPLVIYVVAFVVAFVAYSQKADWIGITTDTFEKSSLLAPVPDNMRDEMVRQGVADMQRMTPMQQTLTHLLNTGTNHLFLFHGMALLYSTLFVMTGALPKLELGRAWVNLLACFGLLLAFLGIVAVAQLAFQEAVDSRLMLTGVAMVALYGAWIWLLDRRARADHEYHRMLSICTTASVVWVLWAVVWLAVSWVTAAPIETTYDELVRTNAAAFVKTGVPAIQAVLKSIEIFNLWVLVVLTIGFRAVTRMSTAVTASITFLPWVVWVLVKCSWVAAFG